MCLLSGDSDGIDGNSPAAGAIVDLDFVDLVQDTELSMKDFLANNDSYTFFSQVNKGKNLLSTSHTGTNVMDMHILLVRKPIVKKYKWKD